jgi:acyl carrier protein
MAAEDRIRKVIGVHGRLTVDAARIAPDADLYRVGLTSHASVNLMLALEDEFDVEFPERMLRRQTFESIAAITAAVDELCPDLAD